ncbi:MAG TPA: saccharopine dehydrogenase NADP-binding domain-containing protein [Chloroflexota bacterium]|nr:saccharopine dehydrogenase NADP-binding domain-containing protein [Chloroflexota bacterium]
MRIAVIGAGAMGRVALADLLHDSDVEAIVVADASLGAASQAASGAQDRVRPLQLDARDMEAARRAMRGCDVVINAAQYDTNVPVLRAAIAERVQYADLGGLFHTTRDQLALDAEAKAAGITAIVGMGGAPGLTNLMARYLADGMEAVHAIHVFLGAVDRTPTTAPFAVPYSIRTILDECTLPPMVFADGAFCAVEPFSGAVEVALPEPVGAVTAHHALHSEVATLPLTYAARGIRDVSFRIAFPAEFARKLRLLVDLGLADTKAIEVAGTPVVPREVLVALVERQPATSGPIDDCDALRVVVEGTRGGQPVSETMDLLFPAHDGLSGGAFDTGVPLAIVARMLARHEIAAAGVLAPEQCLDPATIFDALAARQPIGGWPRR